jgi:hypothetical protein
MNNPESLKKYPFKVTIDDGFGAYEYQFETTREVSIYDIAEQIAKKLRCETPEGKFLES